MSVDKPKQSELERLVTMRDEEIDTSDAPEIADWSKAERGKFFRPVKKQITLRLGADILAWFKAQGDGYQTEINRVLREHVARAAKRNGS